MLTVTQMITRVLVWFCLGTLLGIACRKIGLGMWPALGIAWTAVILVNVWEYRLDMQRLEQEEGRLDG